MITIFSFVILPLLRRLLNELSRPKSYFHLILSSPGIALMPSDRYASYFFRRYAFCFALTFSSYTAFAKKPAADNANSSSKPVTSKRAPPVSIPPT